jgi:hypothetical protein
MARSSQLSHHRIRDMRIPYEPNVTPVTPGVRYVAGQNVLVTTTGALAKRPGFVRYTADEFGNGNVIRRFFHWHAWNGIVYIFCNVITSSTSIVYKQKIGTDSTFQSLHTDSSSTEPFDFVVARNFVFFANGTDMQKYDGTTVTQWGITGPTAIDTPSNDGSGNVPAAIAHSWKFAYGNSNTGHISDLSPASAEVTTASRTWGLGGARSTDAQVNKVHIYRTKDGGSTYYELNGSPITNPGSGDWSHTDNEADDTVSNTKAPVVTINNEPRAGYMPTWFAGRIWWFINDTLYYTGIEEVNNGVFEESAPVDNEYRFGQQITGLATVGGFLLVFTRSGIFRISGDSLSTFRRDTLAATGGAHSRAAITSAGSLVAWLDVANVIRITNGSEIREISQPIRNKINGITHSTSQLAFFDDGLHHWLILTDQSNTQMFVFDMDLDIWQVRWVINKPTAIYAGETAAGTHVLLLGHNNAAGSANRPLNMSLSTFTDNTANYAGDLTFSLFDIAPTNNPSGLGHLEKVILETNATKPSAVKRKFDDDPAVTSGWTDIVANIIDPPGRPPPGNTPDENWYHDEAATGRRVGIQLTWATGSTEFKLYAIHLAYIVDL